MTLLYSCPNCGYAHDVKLEPGRMTPVSCPQCEETYCLELKLWGKKEKYYGTEINSIPLEGMKQAILNKEV